MDLLLLNDADKSHHVHIKDFKRFVFHQTKNKNNGFLEVVYIVLVVKDVLTKHKEDYLSINGKQSVKLEEGTFLVVLLTKLFSLMLGLVSELLFLEVKMLLMNLLKQFVKSMSTVKK